MRFAPAALVALLLVLPAIAVAQTTDSDISLRASIQSALLSDPRTDLLTPDQLELLVTALVSDAKAHNIAPNDISYTPRTPTGFGVNDLAQSQDCGIMCGFSAAYGLSNDDLLTPFLLLVSSGLLIMIIRRMLRPQHSEHFVGTSAPPPPPPAAAHYV